MLKVIVKTIDFLLWFLEEPVDEKLDEKFETPPLPPSGGEVYETTNDGIRLSINIDPNRKVKPDKA